MKPLITIETVPISIEYVEKKQPHTSAQATRLRIMQQNDTMTVHSNPISIPLMDSFESSVSANQADLSYTATAQYSSDGNISMNVKLGDTNANEYVFQQFRRGIDNLVESLPKQATSPLGIESMQINFNISQLPSGLPSVDNLDTSFLPPDLELKVLERPKVIIKYVGGPLYIPKSADPNYVPPEKTNQIFDGKSNFDIKA